MARAVAGDGSGGSSGGVVVEEKDGWGSLLHCGCVKSRTFIRVPWRQSSTGALTVMPVQVVAHPVGAAAVWLGRRGPGDRLSQYPAGKAPGMAHTRDVGAQGEWLPADPAWPVGRSLREPPLGTRRAVQWHSTGLTAVWAIANYPNTPSFLRWAPDAGSQRSVHRNVQQRLKKIKDSVKTEVK